MSALFWIELALAGASLGTSYFASRRASASSREPPETAGVSILRPCEGAEPGLERALRFPSSSRIGPIEMMACTGSLDDPAAEVARKAGATVIVDRQETIDWTNPKVRHLDAGIHAARWLVTWSWDCGDWAGGAEPNAPIRAAHPGDILLMHDGPTRDETARRRTSKALDALATMGPKLEALEDP